MRLTVLGSSASYPGPGQACSGHLLEADGASILLDCGNGVLSNLGRVADPLGLDAVFITHAHPDHFVDLYGLQAALRYAPQGPSAPVPLYMPAGLFESMQLLLSERGAYEFREAFVLTEHVHGQPVMVGDVSVTPFEVEHTPDTFALRVQDSGGAAMVYTADTAYGDAVVNAARRADLLLAEATLPEEYAGAAPHLTASQAGRLATIADVGALVLVHVWPTNNRDRMSGLAAGEFRGPIAVARELDTFEISAAVRGAVGDGGESVVSA